MIKQYLQIKSQYPDSILFFRMGDFYEMFFEDARVGSRELDIALTSRDKAKKIASLCAGSLISRPRPTSPNSYRRAIRLPFVTRSKTQDLPRESSREKWSEFLLRVW